MDFNISSSNLLKGILDVSKAIPGKTPLPILEHILMVVRGDSVELTASDNDLTLRTSVAAESVNEEGGIAVLAHQVIDLLKTIPDQPIQFKTKGDSSFECIWNSGKSSLPFLPAEDYPAIKGASEDARKVVFPAKVLVDGINGTVYATADDEMRPAMNGIFFDLDPEGSTLVASDAHKLICYSADSVRPEEKDSFILHKKPALVLRSIVDKDGDDVQVAYDNTNVVFTFGRTMMICRLIIGKYPKYREVIPKNNANILTIDRILLLGALRRVSVCANKASNHIKFDLREGQLEITAQDLGFATEAYEKISCDYVGGEISRGVKSTFLIETLSHMSCENLVMKFADARRAVLIVPSEEESATEKVCGIIMPIMVA